MAVLPHSPFDIRVDEAAPKRLLFRNGRGDEVLDPGGSVHPDVADVVAGPHAPSWCIQTTVFELPFPSGLRLVSSAEANVPPGFDLVGSTGELIYFQGPTSQLPLVPRNLIGPGETLELLEPGPPLAVVVTYTHDGEQWWQARRVAQLSPASALIVGLQTTHPPTATQLVQLAHVAAALRQFLPAA